MLGLHLDTGRSVFEGVGKFNEPAACPELIPLQIAADGQQVRFDGVLADPIASQPRAHEGVCR